MNPQISQRKLKISLIVSDLSSRGAARWGGAVRPFLLAQALTKLGHKVKMFGVAFDRDASPILNADIPIISIPCNYHAGLVGSAIALSQLLPKIDGDILYAVKLKPTSFGIALLKKLLSRRPLVLDIDDWEMSWFGGDSWQYRPNLKQFTRDLLKSDGFLKHPDNPVYLKWMESLVSHADAITIHTQFIKERFGGTYIPNGKDTTLFFPEKYHPEASRLKYGLDSYKILMFPGAPRPYKGLEDVLIALDKLNREDLRLVIVGGSPYDDYDKQLMEQWGRWIIKLPKSPVQEMPEIVSAAHVIVVPQRNTPAALAQFPLKLTDGMAMAKPVLATRVGDIPEILGDTGYLVDANAPDQIAAQIQWIFEHLDEANERGKRARKRCIERYSIEAMANILSGVIERVAISDRQLRNFPISDR
ncbi:glycosyl transferase group 1 [Hydrococcus rivularis NIES-593]|uniref:Glycosyl transferase group 1 n=1 Tax=Hydrococcus rivularis NIES-593 TaxID=1921803 RepID=A0A1U7H861_9CYAN|nr:glycosyl transferase group 1 [Hydrococcus rivularis NIES-593]